MSNKLITESFTKVKKSSQPTAVQQKVKASQPKGKATPSLTGIKKDDEAATPYEQDMMNLRKFDLDWEYGPCSGITRMERWNRAEKHELKPPTEIRDLITLHSQDANYTKGVWNDYEL